MDSTTPENQFSSAAGSRLDCPLTTAKPALPNFPLPTGLREEIYGYLLDGERTRTFKDPDPADQYAKYQPKRPTYAFSTSLLAVNKTVGSEAAAFFHRQNSFTLVEFRMIGFELMSKLVDLPIVASVGLYAPKRISKSASLMITLSWENVPYLLVLAELGTSSMTMDASLSDWQTCPAWFWDSASYAHRLSRPQY